MTFMQLTVFYCLLIFSAGKEVPENVTSTETKLVEPTKESEAPGVLLQSKDGGQTWQDVSEGLPENAKQFGLTGGASELYLHGDGVMYRSKSNLRTPLWEKENVLPPSRIDFSPSGAIAYSFGGKVYRKNSSSETWSPVYPHFKSQSVHVFFEVSDGTVLLSTGRNVFKSVDKARTWTLVHKGGAFDIMEEKGVLLATGVQGIMRSTDHGDTWEWVISEGGVGIALERIDGGFAAITYNTETRSRRIRASFDNGKTWQAIDEGLPASADISSVKQLDNDLFVGHPDGIFRSSDKGQTWQRVHAAYGNKSAFKLVSLTSATNSAPVERVFKVYVAGDVLYAVAVVPGC